MQIVILIFLAPTAALKAAGEEKTAANGNTGIENPFFFNSNRFRTHFLWGTDFIPTGVDFTVGYGVFRLFGGAETIFQAGFGGI